ncbi:unnamed protein product [Mytilus coruscus]|uniref:Uncharacterized protein n=1 Tax=Mytilus coruscus TaxID=42192 RepID=A0A6J8AQW0_MYTCO|nr:unnamed protein product [Mytilus coruscus]
MLMMCLIGGVPSHGIEYSIEHSWMIIGRNICKAVNNSLLDNRTSNSKQEHFHCMHNQKEIKSVDTIDFEKLLIDEKETGEQASLIMFPTGTLLLLSVEVWNLINNKKERRICDLIICKTTIETPVGSDDVQGDMFVNSPGNPFICKTINCMTISIDHVVEELYLNSQIRVKSNQISISELLYEELIGKP